jgi:hypothetical protein
MISYIFVNILIRNLLRMKKILCLFSALTLVLISSCSSDDSSSSDSSGIVLLKKTIRTDSDGLKITTNFTYDGNKLVSIVDNSGDGNTYYTYTNDLIIKEVYKLPDGTVEQINTYEYDTNKRLVVFVRSEPIDELGTKHVYIYNADGTISIKDYIGDDKSQTVFNGEGKITFTNGEITSITTDYSPDKAYTYDDKNNPMKNVIGLDKIAFEDSDASGIFHNIVSEKDTESNEVVGTYVFTYNSDNYPVKSIDTEHGEKTTTEYFY